MPDGPVVGSLMAGPDLLGPLQEASTSPFLFLQPFLKSMLIFYSHYSLKTCKLFRNTLLFKPVTLTRILSIESEGKKSYPKLMIKMDYIGLINWKAIGFRYSWIWVLKQCGQDLVFHCFLAQFCWFYLQTLHAGIGFSPPVSKTVSGARFSPW